MGAAAAPRGGREQLITEAGSQIQQIRALLECVWPAGLDTARYPFRSKTWAAAMTVICDRDAGDLARTRRLGLARFERAVRREIISRGGQRPTLRIVRKLFAALDDPTGVTAHRLGALERAAFLLADWRHTKLRLAEVEARMTGVLDQLELTDLATSIPGLSPVGAAADPGRDRRPAPIRHRPGDGHPRRAGAAGEALRQPRRTHQAHRAGPSAPAAGGVARGVGSAEGQPRLRRPLPAADHPRTEHAHAHPGAEAPRPCGCCTRSSPPAGPGTPTPRSTAPSTAGSRPPRPDNSVVAARVTAGGRGKPSAALRHT